MTKWMTAALAALAIGLSGCSSDDQRDAQQAAENAQDALPDVDWSAHPPALQKIIDKAARKGDCRALQETFDAQTDPDVLDYIDAQLHEAGCYD